ncbi:hypothetical protein HDU93_009797 [Gonapodya sp. JEL0774]|nr:hypothetical protein HDU93_009797 [Gonapodya sp. JEL0774]
MRNSESALEFGSQNTEVSSKKNYLLGSDFAGSSNLQLSLIGSIKIGGITFLAPWAGQLSDKYGPSGVALCGAILSIVGYVAGSFSTSVWHLYLTQGFMYGLGACLRFDASKSAEVPNSTITLEVIPGDPHNLTPNHHLSFAPFIGLASGISSAGTGAAGLVLAPTTQYLLDRYGCATMRALAAIAASIIVPSALTLKQWRTKVEVARRKGENVKSQHPALPTHLLRDPSFLLTCVTITLAVISFYATQSYMPLALKDGGYSDSVCSAVVAGLSGILTASRVLMGLINEWVSRVRLYRATNRLAAGESVVTCRIGTLNVFFISQLMPALAVVFLWLPGPTSLSWTLAFIFLWGPFAAGLIVALPFVSMELWAGKEGEENGPIVGLLYLSFLPGDLGGQPLLGLLVAAYTMYTRNPFGI